MATPDPKCPDFVPGPPMKTVFETNTHNDHVLWEAIKNEVAAAVNSSYGTDPRHSLIGMAVADKIAFGTPIPWSLSLQFGRPEAIARARDKLEEQMNEAKSNS